MRSPLAAAGRRSSSTRGFLRSRASSPPVFAAALHQRTYQCVVGAASTWARRARGRTSPAPPRPALSCLSRRRSQVSLTGASQRAHKAYFLLQERLCLCNCPPLRLELTFLARARAPARLPRSRRSRSRFRCTRRALTLSRTADATREGVPLKEKARVPPPADRRRAEKGREDDEVPV